MAKNNVVSADDLAAAVMSELNHYKEESTKKLKDSCKIIADDCMSEIVQNSPISTGRYQKGWRVTKELETPYNVVYRVHNKTCYQLVHLLEYGHDKWINGVKIDGQRVAPKVHVRPAEQKAVDKLDRKIKEIY